MNVSSPNQSANPDTQKVEMLLEEEFVPLSGRELCSGGQV